MRETTDDDLGGMHAIRVRHTQSVRVPISGSFGGAARNPCAAQPKMGVLSLLPKTGNFTFWLLCLGNGWPILPKRNAIQLALTKGTFTMATTAKATNGVTLATTVRTAPQAAPAAKPATTAAPLALRHPVNGAQVQAWLNANCGGNPALAGIAPLPNAVAGAGLPFLRGTTSARARILNAHLFGFVNGHAAGTPVSLQGATNYCKATFGAAFGVNGYLDVCALLNGGFSPSSKVWGTAFAELVVLPAPAQPAAK